MKHWLAVVAILVAASSAFASGDGFVPCTSSDEEDDSYHGPLDANIDSSLRGEVLISFTAIPSFENEWGVRLVRSKNGVMVRAVNFDFSVFHSAYREIRPGTFARSPELARYDHSLHEATIDPALARLLEEEVAQEIALADSLNARCGLDGDSYYFRVGNTCGFTCSPPSGTRAERLVDAFHDLNTQASLPTRWFQIFWEKRTLAKLLIATGRAKMPTTDYLLMFVIGVSIVAVAGLPLLVAGVVAFVPSRLKKKRMFALTSGTLAYGATCLVAICALPFFLTGIQLAAQAPVGESQLWIPMHLLNSYALAMLFWCWLAFSIGMPVYLRRTVWPRWTSAIQAAAGDARDARA